MGDTLADLMREVLGESPASQAVRTGAPPPMPPRNYTQHRRLPPGREQQFQRWYQTQAAQTGIDPNPDAPEHFYDYRRAYQAGVGPSPEDGHWPSEFKDDNHPNRYVVDNGLPIDSRNGQPVGAMYLGFNQTLPALAQRPQPNNPAAQRYNARRRNDAARNDVNRLNGPQPAFTPPRNQIAELPQLAFEATGLPSVRRAIDGYRDAALYPPGPQRNDVMQGANEQAIWGGVGLSGWALPGLRGRPQPRAMRAPFPDFGALPDPALRPPPRSAPDASQSNARTAYLDDLRAQGFNVERQLYHGTDQDFENFKGETWLSDATARPNRQSMRGENDGLGANVRPVYARGRIYQFPRELQQRDIRPADIQRVRDEGYDGAEMTAHDGSRNILVFDPANIAPRFGSPRNAPDGGPAPEMRTYYKGSDSPADQALTPSRHTFRMLQDVPENYHEMGEGVYASPYAGVSAKYGGTVYPFRTDRPLIAQSEYQTRLRQIEERPDRARARPRDGKPDYRWSARNMEILNRELQDEGFIGVQGEGFHAYESVFWNMDGVERLPPISRDSIPRVEGRPWDLTPDEFEAARHAPNGSPPRPPDGAKSYRNTKPPSGGFSTSGALRRN